MTPNHQQAADAANPLADLSEQMLAMNPDAESVSTFTANGTLLYTRHRNDPVSPPAASPEQAAPELPEVDVTEAEAAKATACTLLTEGEKSLFAKLLCRERQLRTALAEIASLRPSIAARTIYWNLLRKAGEEKVALQAELAAKDARITALEAEPQRLRQELAKDDDTQAEMEKRIAELTVLGGKMLLTEQKALDRLRAVSEALEQEESVTRECDYYLRDEVHTFFAKLRAIVEGR